MVEAYFVTLGYFGFWLPNDPRGSGSAYVGSKRLLPFGSATLVPQRRKSRATMNHDVSARVLAKQMLSRPPVHLTGVQALSIANGFATVAKQTVCSIYACFIGPDHSHLVLSRHRFPIEHMVRRFKSEATMRLKADGIHPFKSQAGDEGRIPTIWGRGSWNVYLNDETTIRQKIRYVEENAARAGLRRPQWSFVVPYS